MSEAVADPASVALARRMLALRAMLFALVAGVLVALRLAVGTVSDPALWTLLALAAPAAPIATLFASRGLLFARLAAALLVLLVALFALTPLAGRGADPAAWVEAFALFKPWPLIVVALAVGRALDDLAALAETRPARDPAWTSLIVASGDIERIGRSLASVAAYAVAVVAFVLCLAFALAGLVGAPTDAAWLVKTPVHLALLALAALCAVLLVAAMSERPVPPHGTGSSLGEALGFASSARRRYLRTLIALLPVLGFVGTVLGIQRALSSLPAGFSAAGLAEPGADGAFTASLSGIATAFETTLMGLVASFAFQFVLASVERAESDRLVDRLVDAAGR